MTTTSTNMTATSTMIKMERALAWAAAPAPVAVAMMMPAAASSSTASAASTATTTNSPAATRARVKPPMPPPPKMRAPHPLDVFAAAMKKRAAAFRDEDDEESKEEEEDAQEAHDQGEWELARMRCAATSSYVPYVTRIAQTKRGDTVVEAARLMARVKETLNTMASLATAIEAASETTNNDNSCVSIAVIRQRFWDVQDELHGVAESATVLNGMAVSQVTTLGNELTRAAHWMRESEVRGAKLVSQLASERHEVRAQRAASQPIEEEENSTSNVATMDATDIALPTDIDVDDDQADPENNMVPHDQVSTDNDNEGGQVGPVDYKSECIALCAQLESERKVNKRALCAAGERSIVLERELEESRAVMTAFVDESSIADAHTEYGSNGSNEPNAASPTLVTPRTVLPAAKAETSIQVKATVDTMKSGIPAPKIKVPGSRLKRDLVTRADSSTAPARPAVPLIRNGQNTSKNKSKTSNMMATEQIKRLGAGNVSATASGGSATVLPPATATATTKTTPRTRTRARAAVAAPQVRRWR